MKYSVVDVETTGFNKQYDSILSFAYITFNGEGTEVLDSDVLYFYKKGMRLNPEAEAVHGLTRSILEPYAGDYSNNLKKMFKVVCRGNLIGYNSDFFDCPFISNFLDREMYGPQNYNSTTDIMKVFQPVFGKRIKLSEMAVRLGINDAVLEALSQKWFGLPFGWHAAHGDVVATAFGWLEAKRRKLI